MQLLGLVQTYFEIIHVVYFLTINFKGQGVASTNVDYLEQEHLDLWLFQLGSKKSPKESKLLAGTGNSELLLVQILPQNGLKLCKM